MSAQTDIITVSSPPVVEAAPGRNFWRSGENLTLTLALAAMVVLPLAEIVLRKFSKGIPSAPDFLRHLTLIVGMVGGAIAAREGQLLSLSTAPLLLKGAWKSFSQLFSGAFAAAVTALLCVASTQFVLQEKHAGSRLAYDIPLWLVQLAMPIGFGLVTLRLLWHSAQNWSRRAVALALAAGFIAAALWTPMAPASLTWPAMIVMAFATVLGAPVFVTLGGVALILFWGKGVPIAAVPIEHYGLITNPALPAIPLFTLAGYFMAKGSASQRLVRVFQALVGWFRGGPAIATALVCAFFTSFTGASGVTILALGGLLMPVLISARYSERDALGLMTGAGSLGMLLPPCLPVILYAIIAKIDIKEMFLAGLVPGLLLVAMTAGWGIWAGRKAVAADQKFDLAEAGRAVWAAKWELLLPVVALVALFSGWATPVEAAAVTAFYAFIVEVFVYRDLKIVKDCPRVMTECGLLVGGILLILGVALGLTNYLIDAQIPEAGVKWVQGAIHSKWVFLLVLNLFLLVVGCLMDVFSAIVVVAPLLIPLGTAFGLQPVHLGIIFLANLELGYLTPPVGMNLFLASLRFGKPMSEVTRSVLPVLAVMFIGVLLITYVPALTTALPHGFK